MVATKTSQALPFVSIITINWNGRKLLENLLPKLEQQTYPHDRLEIIVLDNDSTRDNSVAYVQQNFPDIKLIQNNRNDGFARGCNLAIKQARGEYFVLVNNDTHPDADWLEALIDCATSEDHVGAVASKVLFANRGKGNIINNAGSILQPNKAWPVEEIGANLPDGPEFSKRREISVFSGTSVLLSRAMLREIGLFDELLFMYWEDSDLSWRGQKAGWKFYYEPKSVISHDHSASSKEYSDFWTFYVTRNRLVIMWKHAKLLLALRVYASFNKQFIAVPIVRGLQGRDKRHQLHQLKLGLRISGSFLVRLVPTLLKRIGLLHDKRLSA